MIAGQTLRPLGYSPGQFHRVVVIAGKFGLLYCVSKFRLDFPGNLGAFQTVAYQFQFRSRLFRRYRARRPEEDYRVADAMPSQTRLRFEILRQYPYDPRFRAFQELSIEIWQGWRVGRIR